MRQGGRKFTRSVEDWTFFKGLGLLSTRHFGFLLICDLSIPYAIGHMNSKMKLLEEEGGDWEPETFFFRIYLSGRFCTIIVLSKHTSTLDPTLTLHSFPPHCNQQQRYPDCSEQVQQKILLLSLLCFNYEHISVPSMCDLCIEDTDLCDSIIICGRINSS